jgi:hypothetical protein
LCGAAGTLISSSALKEADALDWIKEKSQGWLVENKTKATN